MGEFDEGLEKIGLGDLMRLGHRLYLMDPNVSIETRGGACLRAAKRTGRGITLS